jgi:hypothetical protein
VLDGATVKLLDVGTSVAAINNSGAAAGVTIAANDNSRAFRLNAHGHALPFGPRFSDVDVSRIDSFGNVVGTYLDKRSRFHGFVFASGQFVKIDEPDAGKRAPFSGTKVFDVNSSGVLTGIFVSNRYRDTAFIRTP